jgi:Xaa-Pro aminopeptidase
MSGLSRRQRLLLSFEPDDLDGLLVSGESNLGYLTGFSGDASTLLITRERAIVISDGRYTLQLEQECPEIERQIRPIGQPMSEGVGELLAKLGSRRVGIESDETTVAEFQALQKSSASVEFVPTRGKVEALRMVKDDGEIAAIREAVRIAELAFLDLRAILRPGLTEKAAADALESLLRAHGATSASFPPIVATGRRAALPHARPSQDQRIESDSLVLIDWGASGRPYKSDLTRVLTTGKVSREFETAYTTVLEAQRRAIAAIRPGVEARAIDEAARSVIDDAGFGPCFNHSVGHGIGRDVHEAPILRNVTQTPLEPGMVVTVEPGVYFPEWGGIRIEDDVLVTESGCEVLSTLPRSLDSMAL